MSTLIIQRSKQSFENSLTKPIPGVGSCCKCLLVAVTSLLNGRKRGLRFNILRRTIFGCPMSQIFITNNFFSSCKDYLNNLKQILSIKKLSFNGNVLWMLRFFMECRMPINNLYLFMYFRVQI